MRILSSFNAGALLCAALVPAQAAVVQVAVTSPHYVRETPVSVVISQDKLLNAAPFGAGEGIPGQIEPVGDGQMRLSFIARDLKANEKRTFSVNTNAPNSLQSGVAVKQNGANVDFLINDKLFTRYDTTTGPTKPYFYPLFAPGDKQIVRHWPVEKIEGQVGTTDHPHHRGLWFTHGKVNGTDFWLENDKAGKTIHSGYGALRSGAVYGLMQATTNWVKPDGTKIAEDARETRVYNLQSGTLMDFSITLKPVGAPLVLGDTKEGTLALRLADSMRAAVEKGKTAEGHILNSQGDQDAKTWGKSAAWVDYYGPVNGEVVGVAIFDDPKNPRHPTTWHVRDYGLFAVNPFGLHDFDKKNPEGAGDITVPEGQSITFSYRLFFHKGTTQEANVAQLWQTFATPPLAVLE
jgi:hypothetical protein